MIALTGATGFIGSYIAKRLPGPIKILSRQSQRPDLSNPSHHWIKGNLCDPSSLHTFVQSSPVLIHLACSTTPRTSDTNWIPDIHNNVIPSVNLFEAYAKSNPEGHIIFSSTGGNMYPLGPHASPFSEDDNPSPRSGYGIHKLSIEHYLRILCENYRLRGTILRISNPYGTLLPTHRAQGLIGVAFAKILANEPLNIVDSLHSVRDYIHLDDLLKAFELSITSPPQQGECRIFNVGSSQGHSLKAVLNLIEKTTDQTLKKNIPPSLPPPSVSILSFEKIQKTLGWAPKITLEDGIQRMWEHCEAMKKLVTTS